MEEDYRIEPDQNDDVFRVVEQVPVRRHHPVQPRKIAIENIECVTNRIQDRRSAECIGCQGDQGGDRKDSRRDGKSVWSGTRVVQDRVHVREHVQKQVIDLVFEAGGQLPAAVFVSTGHVYTDYVQTGAGAFATGGQYNGPFYITVHFPLAVGVGKDPSCRRSLGFPVRVRFKQVEVNGHVLQGGVLRVKFGKGHENGIRRSFRCSLQQRRLYFSHTDHDEQPDQMVPLDLLFVFGPRIQR